MARHHVMYSGLLGPVTQTRQPAQVEGVRQMGGEGMPTACPHCHVGPPAWTAEARSGHCRTCGADWYRTAYRITAPTSHRGGNPHPVRPR